MAFAETTEAIRVDEAKKKEKRLSLGTALVGRVVGAALAFLANIFIGRMIGPSAYGSYLTLLSIAMTVSAVAVFGADRVITREIARRDPDEQRKVIYTLFRWVTSFDGPILLGTITLLALWFYFYPQTQRDNTTADVATVSIIPVYFATLIASSALLGFNRVGLVQILDNVIKNCILIFGIGVIFISNEHLTQARMLFLQLITYLCILLIAVIFLQKTYNNLPPLAANSRLLDTATWRTSARHFLFGGLALTMFGRLDVVLVNALGGPLEAGLFGAANRLAQIAGIASLVIINSLQPRMARASAIGHDEFMQLYRHGQWAALWLTLIAVTVTWVAAAPLLSIMGSGFIQATWSLRILLLGYIVWSYSVPGYAFLSMTGSERALAYLAWAQIGITIILSLMLVPLLGAVGASIAFASGTATVATGTTLVARTKVRHLATVHLCGVRTSSNYSNELA